MAPTPDTPPSLLAVAFATSIIAGLGGYFLGQATSVGVFGKTNPPVLEKESDASGAEEDGDTDEEQDLKSFDGTNEECKLVLVVRTDLGMTKGTVSGLVMPVRTQR